MALGRVVETVEVEAVPVAVVEVAVGAVIIVVGSHEDEESVMVEVASRLVPMLCDEVELVVATSSELVVVAEVSTDVADTSSESEEDEVMLGGNVNVADSLVVDADAVDRVV